VREHGEVTNSEPGGAVGQEIEQGSSPAAELIERIASKLGPKASVSAVYGEPIDRDGVTIIPVARVSLGFGAGAGRGQHESQIGQGGGGGGGAAAVPVGYIEIKDGNAAFKRVLHPLLDVALPLAVALLGAAAPRALRRLRRGRAI
jgi:uncharacterized spore protein YtfJ